MVHLRGCIRAEAGQEMAIGRCIEGPWGARQGRLRQYVDLDNLQDFLVSSSSSSGQSIRRVLTEPVVCHFLEVATKQG